MVIKVGKGPTEQNPAYRRAADFFLKKEGGERQAIELVPSSLILGAIFARWRVLG